ncbi:glycosyltransferase [Pelosinus baikalensis]|uniref:Glycosyltransferase n=1 Tax=Pelosinus baikalensis TaxID=2892015 RepID=A0ABS8HUP3_9FIRM|nr:glycosyltransferase [Pelosinus baikalensis]MCC5466893.1 glycosyltransferase [Pelosinus baikalensis]
MMTNKKKVMFISYHGDPLEKLGGIQSGGQNTYVKEVVSSLESLGLVADVFTHWSDPAAPQIQLIGKKSRVIRLEAGQKGFQPKQLLYTMLPNFIKDITAFMQSPYQYSLIHSNYWLSGTVGRYLKNKYSLPLVHTSHSLGIVRKNAVGQLQNNISAIRIEYEKELLQKADCIIATTSTEENLLHEFYQIELKKIKIVPCGVNTDIFRPLQHNAAIGYNSNNHKILLFVGRFEENKGLAILLQAIVALRKKYPQAINNLRLLIGGGDPLNIPETSISVEKKQYQHFINQHSLADHIQFLGPLKHEELAQYLSVARATIVPSYYESFGLVAIEAMACGSPVIASDTGGLAHNVLHGKTGLLVEPKNPLLLAEAIHELLINDSLNKWMSKNAAAHAKRFSWLQVAKDLTKIYRGVVACQEDVLNIRQSMY